MICFTVFGVHNHISIIIYGFVCLLRKSIQIWITLFRVIIISFDKILSLKGGEAFTNSDSEKVLQMGLLRYSGSPFLIRF